MKNFSRKSLSVLGKAIIMGGMAAASLLLTGPARAEDAPAAPVQLSPSMPPLPAPGMAPPPAMPDQQAAPAAAPIAEMPEQALAPPPAPPSMPSPVMDAAAAPAPQPPGMPPMPPAAEESKKTAKKGKDGKKNNEIPVEKANIRPLPEKYLIVKKEHDADDFSARLTSARAALSHDRHGVALELFNDLYAKHPKDKSVLMGRAVAMQRLGQHGEALAAYEEVLTNDPKNLEALTNMLGILNTQDRSSAIERLSQLQQVYPFNADIAAQLGMVYGAGGEYEKALKYLDMADAMKPGNPDILYNRAVAYDRMGNARQAARLYHQLVLMSGETSFGTNFPIEAIKKRLADIR